MPPDLHPPDFMGGKTGKLFPAPLGFAVFWFCGKCVGRSGRRCGAKCQQSEFSAENGSGKSTDSGEMFVAVHPPRPSLK